jgi:hypothetical protein
MVADHISNLTFLGGIVEKCLRTKIEMIGLLKIIFLGNIDTCLISPIQGIRSEHICQCSLRLRNNVKACDEVLI